MFGSNAVFCLKSIPFLSAAPLAGVLLALRQGAPENPGLAGAAAGLFAGAIGAACYATHCPDDSPLFVAAWYSLAIGFVVAAGALVGRRLLPGNVLSVPSLQARHLVVYFVKARNSLRKILPTLDFGNSSRNSTNFGIL
jgi:Negative regulator of sigma F